MDRGPGRVPTSWSSGGETSPGRSPEVDSEPIILHVKEPSGTAVSAVPASKSSRLDGVGVIPHRLGSQDPLDMLPCNELTPSWCDCSTPFDVIGKQATPERTAEDMVANTKDYAGRNWVPVCKAICTLGVWVLGKGTHFG